jgi:hypothetical protein
MVLRVLLRTGEDWGTNKLPSSGRFVKLISNLVEIWVKLMNEQKIRKLQIKFLVAVRSAEELS